MLCLDRGRDRLAALFDRFEHADRDTVVHAAEAVAALPELSICSDVESLRNGLAPPDPDEAARVSAIRSRLAESRTLEMLDKLDQAHELAQEQLKSAAGLRYQAARAEAMFQLGRVLIARGTDSAVHAGQGRLIAASHLAERNRHDELVVEIWLRLLRSAARHRLDVERARAWSERALAVIGRIGDPASYRAYALREKGIIAYKAGEFADAETLQRQALDVLDSDPSTPGLIRARHLHDLAVTVQARRRDEARRSSAGNPSARDLFDRALQLYQAELGDQHPFLSRLRYDIAMMYIQRGELSHARASRRHPAPASPGARR